MGGIGVVIHYIAYRTWDFSWEGMHTSNLDPQGRRWHSGPPNAPRCRCVGVRVGFLSRGVGGVCCFIFFVLGPRGFVQMSNGMREGVLGGFADGMGGVVEDGDGDGRAG